MMLKKLLSALFYGLASLFIVFANKIVLTSYSFPSFQILALGQLVVTLVGFQIANVFSLIKLPEINFNYSKKIMPLPVLFFGNLLFGLGGTKSISLPMFSVLRRFSVLITMYGELYFLRVNKPFSIQLNVYLMVFGAVVAAYDDLAFDIYGYVYVMLNNIFSAFNGIFTKEKLDHSNLGEYGLLYYNALFTIFPMFFLSIYTGELEKLDDFDHWFSVGFWFFFVLSSFMGFLLNYSTMLCTRYNSPLTTTVIGCLKNILVTFAGMFVGGDYVFSIINFLGLTISAGASVVYSYLTFKTPKKTVNTQLSTSILPQLQPSLELIEQIQQNQKEQNLQKIDEENENNYKAKISSNKSKHQSSGSINRSASRSVSSNEYESIDRKIEEDDEDLKDK